METYRTIRAARIAAALNDAAMVEIRAMIACKKKIEKNEGCPCAIRKEFAKVAGRAEICVLRADKFLKNCAEFDDIEKMRDEFSDLYHLYDLVIDFFMR